MANKTATILARVEPEVKEEAEEILSQLGISSSVVINALYKKIIRTRGIPFTFDLSTNPVARDEMTDREFDIMMERGLSQAKNNESRPAKDVISDIKKDIKEWTR
ncbi:MAG: type II toxin-antitoxin system RelB/DinJ family antitoxin [Oribacterium sp.]|nr:type II toxin-antitoxin system RelB/DinJ family antitoxin [Oribacterium sp.]